MDIRDLSGSDVVKIAALISGIGVAYGTVVTQQKNLAELARKNEAEILRLNNKIVVLEVRVGGYLDGNADSGSE